MTLRSTLLAVLMCALLPSLAWSAQSDLRLNEIMPDPDTDWNGDGSFSNSNDEFIEIYNFTGGSVDMGGMLLGDDPANPQWTIPAGTVVQPNCFIVFYGSDWSGFGLDNFPAASQEVVLALADGTVVDSFSYSVSSDDIAYRRDFDGLGPWGQTPRCPAPGGGVGCPNPGQSNDGFVNCGDATRTPGPTRTPSPTPTFDPNLDLYINELMPAPATDWDGDGTIFPLGDEFIEIYNGSNKVLNLSGYWLGDGGGLQRWQIPNGTFIAPNCFVTFYGSEYDNFSQNNSGGETIYLTNDAGVIIDQHTYSTTSADVAIRRQTDGGPNWVTSAACPAPGGGANCPNPNESNNGAVSCGSTGNTPTPTPAGTLTPTPTFNLQFPVRLNEFIPNPASDWNGDGSNTEQGDEWVELFNLSPNDVDLSGWHLGDEVDQLRYQFPAGTMIQGRCFLLVLGSEYGGFLNNSGDTVFLSDPSGMLVDSHAFTSSSDDVAFQRDVDGNGAWGQTTSCAAPGGGPGCPNPDASNDGSPSCGQPTPTPAGPTATPTMPPTNTPTETPTQGPPTATPSFDPQYPVRINEILPDPDTDWNGNGAFSGIEDEFIELYNLSLNTVDLSGWHLGDDTDRQRWQIPSGTTIAPNCFVTFYASDYTTFSLNNGGDTAYLVAPDGTTVDSYNYTLAENDRSWRRDVDGAGAWVQSDACAAPGGGPNCPNPNESNDGTQVCSTPTPGPTATPTPPGSPTATPTFDAQYPLRINEIMPDPNSDWDGSGVFSGLEDEFIEIYNLSLTAVNLSGWYLGDDTDPQRWQIPNGTVLNGNCFITFYSSQYNTFTLNNGGDTAYLVAPDGAIVDSFNYTMSENDRSYRRDVDGTGAWVQSNPCGAPGGGVDCPNPNESNDGTQICVTPTPGGPTVTPFPTATTAPTATPHPLFPVVINEIMPDPDTDWDGNGEVSGVGDEYIELYNYSDQPVDIRSLWLGDSGGVQRYRLSSAGIIPPRCFAVIYGTENTSFSLNNGGDDVFLSDQFGDLVDSFTYSGSFNDRAWKRSTDGGPDWVESDSCPAPGGGPNCPNPGESNDGTTVCVTPTPTATPTATPTSPFSPTPIPTSTPTPPIGNAGVEIDAEFPAATRVLGVDLRVFNLGFDPVPVQLFVVLEISGVFYYYPTFLETPVILAEVEFPANFDSGFFDLYDLPLPDLLGAQVPLTWYAAILHAPTGQVIGDVSFDTVVID